MEELSDAGSIPACSNKKVACATFFVGAAGCLFFCPVCRNDVKVSYLTFECNNKFDFLGIFKMVTFDTNRSLYMVDFCTMRV